MRKALRVLTLGLGILAGCDRPPCQSEAVDPSWDGVRKSLLPQGVRLCSGTPEEVVFEFDPEPATFADVEVVQHLEAWGWRRLRQSTRKEGRKYILERQTETLTLHSVTEKGRTQFRYVYH